MTLVEEIQKDYLKEDIPDFDVGDTVQVDVIISEGGAKRTQQFEGYVTARKGSGLDETFTVRKMVQGEGVERVFPLHSPKIDSIEKVRSGRVRRSKLYYLSEQKGKAAEIREDREDEEEEQPEGNRETGKTDQQPDQEEESPSAETEQEEVNNEEQAVEADEESGSETAEAAEENEQVEEVEEDVQDEEEQDEQEKPDDES